MLVVKLGGSLLGAPELQAWLDMLATQSDGRVIIVPGGGVFADAVREAQKASGFDEATAHRLALLAMDQYGLLLQSLRSTLVIARTELEIAERSWQHRAIVWLPSRMVLADESVPASWDVTSDSLAAWLARKISAQGLVLVKHPDVIDETMPISQLMTQGILDRSFMQFGGQLSCPVRVIGKAGYADFLAQLASWPGLTPARVF